MVNAARLYHECTNKLMSANISSIVSLLGDTLRRRCDCVICETEIDELLKELLRIEKDNLIELTELRSQLKGKN